MAGGEEEAEDRTEAPTPRRLDKAREEGQVPNSREASGFAALLCAAVAIATVTPAAGAQALAALRSVFARSHELGPEAAWAIVGPVALVLLPVLGAVMVGAVAGTMLQTRGLVSAQGLKPQFSKLSPIAGVRKIVGMDALAEFLKTLLKMAVVGTAVWRALDSPAVLGSVLHLSPGGLLGAVSGAAGRLAVSALAAFALVAGADLLWVRFRHVRKLRMSLKDMKDEAKDTDGDPHVKAQQKQIRAQRSRQRMMAAVPKAAVVITNPTHYAVALAYEEGAAAAPKIVAKGADAIAARIRETAKEAGVPLVSNPPLARALYKLEVDTEIPAAHYQAVAEIIAFVWRARRPRSGGTG
ncbi:EscU/YscU/HrcU family type III secretion system export apparatus switch protein [Muricoccus radiodurans]|uniref:EscU/YscU/HrcU family type III secretion system export apparatus switch protein n=1 Tax=Muricoccus radiodurans TaxID=2231721 RepID=UPI003CECDFE0